MERQSKLDLVAAGAIAMMFFGAFMLTVTPVALYLIAGGGLTVLLLVFATLREGREPSHTEANGCGSHDGANNGHSDCQ